MWVKIRAAASTGGGFTGRDHWWWWPPARRCGFRAFTQMKLRYSPRALGGLAAISDYLVERSPAGAQSVEQAIRTTVSIAKARMNFRNIAKR